MLGTKWRGEKVKAKPGEKKTRSEAKPALLALPLSFGKPSLSLLAFQSKKQFILIILWFQFLYCASCGINPLRPNIITNLRFSPDTFDSYKRNTSLKYTLLKEAFVTIEIYDSNGNKVKTLLNNLLETKGSHSHGWLGISDKGVFVPASIYIAKVKGEIIERLPSSFPWSADCYRWSF